MGKNYNLTPISHHTQCKVESRTKSERFLKQQNFQNISQKNIFLKCGKERFLKHYTKALKIKNNNNNKLGYNKIRKFCHQKTIITVKIQVI